MVWVLVIIFILIILFVAIYYLTYKILFFPLDEQVWVPEDKHTEVFIPSDNKYDGTKFNDVHIIPRYQPCITCWHFNKFDGRPTVIFFHGQTGNISHRKYVWEICQKFNLNLLLVDYRGYGKSRGDPTPQGICDDGLVAYDYLYDIVKDPNDIVLWGESLGGAVAVSVASKRRCRCLLLLATFSSLDDAIFMHDSMPWYMKTLGIVIKHFIDNVPSKDRIRKVLDPIVIMHSKEDELIPYENSKILIDNIQHEFKDLITIRGTHGKPQFNNEDMKRYLHYILDYDRSPTLNNNMFDDLSLTPIRDIIEDTADYLQGKYSDDW